MLVNILGITDDAKCFEMVRQLRWPEGTHQPLRVWVLGLYFMGLNLSNEQIAQELDPDDAQRMTTLLRDGIVQRKPEVKLNGEVECDEVYVVAGQKGHPEAVRNKARAAKSD